MRLIDADDALERLKKAEQEMKVVSIVRCKAVPMDGVIEFLETRPTVDAVEVVHGRWNWISDSVVSCSNCERNFYSEDDVNAGVTWFYCPKCGAKMDGGTENAC